MAKLIEITGKVLSGEWGTDDETGNGIPVLRTTNFTNEGIVDYSNVVTRNIVKKGIEEKYLRNGDIIIEKSGGSDKQPVGRVIYFDGPERTYLFNNFTGLLRVKNQEKWHPRYVFYSLFSNYRSGGTRTFQNKTTGLHNLKTDDYVSSFNVTENDIATQEAICKNLDLVDGIIRMHQKQLQKLDDLIKARFIELFVATDEASDWPYCTIADVSNDMRTGPFGSALHHDEFVDSGVFVLGIDNAVENKFSYNRMRYITAEKYQALKRYTVYPGDVIITIMGTVGRSAVIPADMPKAINTKHLACITPNVKMVNAQFLSCAFQVHPDIRAQLQKQCKGAIMDGLNLTIIKGLSFHIPPINLQDWFVGFYEQVDKSKVAVQKALDEAQLLFDSLMQKYFG